MGQSQAHENAAIASGAMQTIKDVLDGNAVCKMEFEFRIGAIHVRDPA